MGDKASFMDEFEQRVSAIPGVERVEFFGSILTDKFVQGRSDIDVAVFGEVSAEDKHRIRLLIRDLSKKYDMKLEQVPFLHPTPFFVPPKREKIFRETFNGHLHLIRLAEPIRRLIKKYPPLTHDGYWRLEERFARIPFFHRVFYLFW